MDTFQMASKDNEPSHVARYMIDAAAGSVLVEYQSSPERHSVLARYHGAALQKWADHHRQIAAILQKAIDEHNAHLMGQGKAAGNVTRLPSAGG